MANRMKKDDPNNLDEDNFEDEVWAQDPNHLSPKN